jgi:hypothetical protein
MNENVTWRSYMEIIGPFLENKGFSMSTYLDERHRYTYSKQSANKISFVIKHYIASGLVFYWETTDEAVGKFGEKLPEIKKLFPDAYIKPGQRNNNRRQMLFRDSFPNTYTKIDKFLEIALKIIQGTRRIMFY